MNCPNCQTQNPDGAKFCFNCGNALALTCSNCGTSLPAGAKFCFNCGHSTAAEAASPPVPAPAVEAPPVSGPPDPKEPGDLLHRYIPKELLTKIETAQRSGLMEGERRVVTILFCDLKGSTAAAAGLDPEEWGEIINGAFEHMIEPVYKYEGTVARLMGDGLLAFFGAPIAHEDDPQRAILAGLDIVEAVDRYAEKVKRSWGLDIAVRVGINTGLVVVGAVGSDLRMEYTALGDAINLAARMEQTAVPGTVQIAEATHRLTAPLFDFETIQDLHVKGIEDSVTAYRVLAPRAEPGSLRGIAGLEAPLVGREAQLEILRSALDELGRGSGQIVSLIGEAGLGKSRLVAEARSAGTPRTAGASFDGRWLEGRSQSFETSTPYAPFAVLFKDYFGLETGGSDRARVSRIKERVETLFPGRGDEIAPFFAAMLDIELERDDAERVKYLEPPALRGMTFRHVSDLIEAHVASQPLVLVLDDLHWVDPTSLELLHSLLPLVDRAPLMLLVAFRPRRGEPSWRFHEEAGRDYHHRYKAITLSPLDQGQARELVAGLLEVEDLPEKVRQTILDKSEGNPFYVEEIIRSLLDSGAVIRQEGHWRATKEILDIAIPDTLVGVITARLDKLDEGVRQIAGAAAVLGRDFSPEVLADLLESPGALEGAIIELQRRELIVEKSRLPHRSYAFKHVLSQQAAYGSLLLSNRRVLHRRAAGSLTIHEPENAAAIGRHWLEARQPSRAVPFLVEAGNRAARSYATAEAIDFYQQVLAHQDAVEEITPVRLAYEGLGGALTFANRIPETMENYQAMLAYGEAHGDAATQISALNKLASTTALRLGQFQQADQFLARVDALASQHDDSSGTAEKTLIYCQVCTAQADFESVVEHMSELVEMGQQQDSKEYIAIGLEHVASSLMYLTRFDEAREKAEEALAISREIGDREREASLLATTLPLIAIRNGDFETAQRYLDEGLRVGTKIGAFFPQVLGNWIQGELAQLQGEYEQAISCGQMALRVALPVEEFMPFMVVPPLGSLGSAYLGISESFMDEITKFHHHALRLLESPAATMTAGTAWADLGHCALKLGDLELAEEVFEKGLNIPTMFTLLERARLLAGSALLASVKGDLDKASRLAREALSFAQEKGQRNMIPLTAMTMGDVLAAQGESKAALEHYRQAESEALAMGMRPYAWQSQLAAAETLEAIGERDEAAARQAAARLLIEEIAGLLTDEGLRSAYLASAMPKVGPATTSPVKP